VSRQSGNQFHPVILSRNGNGFKSLSSSLRGHVFPTCRERAPTLSPAEKPIVASVDANEQTSNARLEKVSGIVDDNEVSRSIPRDLLNQPWLDFREAATGSEAMKLLNDSLPDAVILDFLMPDMSGCEIL
jgi:PleD family two-component response regulator